MSHNHSRTDQASRDKKSKPFAEELWEELNSGELNRSVQRDVKDIYQFYLDEESRKKLAEMGQFERTLNLIYWVLKSSILKLSSIRRLVLLASLILFFFGLVGVIGFSGVVVGFALLLFVLLLELKDKLLAQDELASGRAVQFALMPTENPAIRGWETWLFTRPANDVGGDLVDFLILPGNRLGISLGDVAGKGLPAALFMAKLQSTIRAIAANYDSLAELGSEINAIFRRDGLPDRFASLVYLEIGEDTNTVRVLNAGHFPPVVVGERAVRELPKGGPALGLARDIAFEEHCAALDPGDLLIVYSDGLTEARDEQGEFFESRRLKSLLPHLRGLSPRQAGMRLLNTIEGFIGEARPSDDLSLVVLRRAPVSERIAPERRHPEVSLSVGDSA